MSNELFNIHVPAGFELRSDENGKFYFAPIDDAYAHIATAHTKTAKATKPTEQVETLFNENEMDEMKVSIKEKKGKKNSNLHTAKDKKDDEFYTRIEDIDAELRYYRDFLKGKVIYCPCDKFIKDGRSMFVEYFSQKFFDLGLKEIIISYFDENGHGHATHCTGDIDGNGYINADDFEDIELVGNGSFDSYECKELMKHCDVVVTNPPFSLFRTFVEQIINLDKKFIIIGNQNALTYKEIFPLIKNGEMAVGYTYPKNFMTPLKEVVDEKKQYIENGVVFQKFGNICWFTNFDIEKRHQELPLCRSYYNDDRRNVHYPKYDNYDAIECSKTKNIPMDYEKEIGVPITFLNNYSEDQFEIINLSRYLEDRWGMKQSFVDAYYAQGGTGQIMAGHPDLSYYDSNGKAILPYMRVIIRLKNPKKC